MSGGVDDWQGRDDGNPDPSAGRRVFLDRDPDDVLVAALAVEGMAPAGPVS